MRKMGFELVTLGFASLLSASVYAGTANVTTTDLKSEPRQEAAQELSRVFDRMSKRLPEGYLLDVHITDMHLATVRRDSCEAHPGSLDGNGRVYLNNQCSTVDPKYNWPRLTFHYTLKDNQGNTVIEGKEELKDMSYFDHADMGSVYRYKYETKMVKDWFRQQSRDKVFPPDAS